MKLNEVEIGASEVGAILGLDSFRSRMDVWARKTGRTESDGGSNATFLGQHLEHAIATMFEEQHGVQIRRWDSMFSTSKPWLRATPDRVLLYDDMTPEFRKEYGVDPGECFMIEIKTTGLAGFMPPSQLAQSWGPDGGSKVPAKYAAQVQVQMFVGNEMLGELGAGYFARSFLKALIPGRGAPEFMLRLVPDIQEQFLEGIERFVLDHLVTDVPPPATDAHDWRALADAVRVPMRSKTMIPTTADLDAAIVAYIAARDAMKQAEEEKEAAGAKLKMAIGDCYGVQSPLARVLYTGGKEAPKFSKSNFADDVLALVRAEVASENAGRRKLATTILEYEKKNTKPSVSGRSLRITPNESDKSDE